ncbi:Solute carrier family 35 member G1 [Halotydeus destructor]|nr:Solute carrier family 35 member G1 [Halotydeus destructor]
MKPVWGKLGHGTVLTDPSFSLEERQLQVFRNFDEYSDADDESSRLNNDSDTQSLFEKERTKFSIFQGIIYSSLSSLFFSLSSVIVKKLDDIHPSELAIFRFLGILIITTPLVLRSGENILGPPNLRHFLVLRALAGATSLSLRFFAFRYLPIADASVIIFSVPVFVSIFACLCLNEPCGIFQFLSVCLTMFGLGLTTKVPLLFRSSSDLFAESNMTSLMSSNMTLLASTTMSPPAGSLEHLYGVLAAATSTIFGASVFIFVRKAKSVHHYVIMFNFGWIATIETVIITFLMDGFSWPKNSWEWYYILALGVFSFFGQILLTRSLQLEAAGPVSVVRAATDIALAFIWQLWFFNDIPDMWSISGALIVTFCVLLTSVRKWILSLPEHSEVRQKLLFVT